MISSVSQAFGKPIYQQPGELSCIVSCCFLVKTVLAGQDALTGFTDWNHICD